MTLSSVTSTTASPSLRRADPPESLQQVGAWELVEAVYEGPLARTYRARPAGSPGESEPGYALKMLRRRWFGDPRAVAMLRREAHIGQTVSHRHLVSVLAADVQQPPYYLVAPWLEGATLHERLQAGEPMDVPLALWIARQVAEAMEALWGAGWTHGDVKPGNIHLGPGGHVTLLDLGFARRPDETGSAADRCVMGTCRYIAPEAVTSALAIDTRSDIYSLGVVLFEMLSGQPPFEAESLAGLVEAHKQTRAPNLRRRDPHLPTDVTRLVAQMLAKQPLRRPQTPGELVQRLTALEIATFTERSF